MRLKLTALIVLVFTLVGLYTYKKFVTPFSRGDLSPLFVLKDIDGNEVSLAKFRGSMVLVHFWATWCPNCVSELPHLDRFAAENPELVILSISEDDSAETVLNFLGDVKLSMLILLDENSRVADLFKSYMVPQSFLLDEDGRFVDFFIGPQNWLDSKLLEKLKKDIPEL